MTVTIKDVAKKANVSIATVSHVINNTKYVSEELRTKVISAMNELNYTPNSVAKRLRSKKSNIVALIVPVLVDDTSSLFFMTIAQGIENTLKKHGYSVMLSNSNEELEREKELIKLFNTQMIDGLIIAPTKDDHNFMNEILDGSYPVVFIDRMPKGYLCDCVLSDNFKGSYEAVHTLIKRGHKKIGFISGSLGITTSDERIDGYKRAIINNNLELIYSLIKIGDANFENGYKFAQELVENEGATALFVANNVMTNGALKYLNDNNIKVPNEVGIIGYDDYQWTQITNPPLSIVKQYPYEMGVKAAEVLLNKINKKSRNYKEYRLPTKLIIRGT
ncbi:LacI family DNA-binding transcriptional regulator [Caldicellulosiruptoraceae bacterium PP1]